MFVIVFTFHFENRPTRLSVAAAVRFCPADELRMTNSDLHFPYELGQEQAR
jgi:hypothetical protein